MIQIDTQKLIKAASDASVKSYSPYSHFRVGAAILCVDGTIVTGTNVENRSYGLTICAERSAVCNAINNGSQRFKAIAIYSPDSVLPLPPCGACRQVLSEFAASGFTVIMAGKDRFIEKTIEELLPFDSLHDLKGKF
jgi:cytidine deaminase